MSAYLNALSEEKDPEILYRQICRLYGEKREGVVPQSSVFDDTSLFNTAVLGLMKPTEPTMMSRERMQWTVTALEEEIKELVEAHGRGDMPEVCDALIDLIYFAAGRLHELGIDAQPRWDEVHKANMQKVRGLQAKRPGSRGFDAVKPDGWQAPKHRVLMPKRPKVLVIGHGRHGKDTVAERLQQRYGLSFTSSSLFCAEKVIWPTAQELAKADCYEYGPPALPWTIKLWEEACRIIKMDKDAKDAFLHRHHSDTTRQFWFEAIKEFNRKDAAALGKAIFDEYDIYCGLRSSTEFHALKNAGVIDHVVWVDRGEAEPPEPSTSITVQPWMADYIIDNNSDLDHLNTEITRLFDRLMKDRQHG